MEKREMESEENLLDQLNESRVIPHHGGNTRFSIQKRSDIGTTDKLRMDVELSDLVGSFTFDPESCVREPVLKKFNVLDISVVQAIPVEETADSMRYRLIIGTDNGCCNGALLYMDYLFEKGNHNVIAKSQYLSGVNVPFTIGGVIGTAKEVKSAANGLTGGAIVYGQGCSGYGIRLVDFCDRSIGEIMSTKDAQRVARHVDWTHKPAVNNGELWVPRRRTDDLPYVLRNLNLGNGVCIDELFGEYSNGSTKVLEKIKTSAGKSSFIYGRNHKQSPAFEPEEEPSQKKLKLLVGDDRFKAYSGIPIEENRAVKGFMQEYESILNNMDVTFVGNANQMIEFAARTEYDALMIDLNWGYHREEDGYRILDAVSLYSPKRILWTGDYSEGVQKEARSHHASACIPKHLEPEELVEIIRN